MNIPSDLKRKFGRYVVQYWINGNIRRIDDYYTGQNIIDENTLLFEDEKLHILNRLTNGGF